jgi:hypothetical protein
VWDRNKAGGAATSQDDLGGDPMELVWMISSWEKSMRKKRRGCAEEPADCYGHVLDSQLVHQEQYTWSCTCNGRMMDLCHE